MACYFRQTSSAPCGVTAVEDNSDIMSLCARDFCKNGVDLSVTNVGDAGFGSRGGTVLFQSIRQS